MDGALVAAALLSAFLHAAWNAAVKASPDAQDAMAAQVVASGLISAPLLLFVPLPSLTALPWLCASTGFNMLAMLALLRGYACGGGFGLVYPLTRAVSPLLVTLFASALHGERLSPVGMAGVALVSGGVALFAHGRGGGGEGQRAALTWALAAGAVSAAYAVCDAQGARLSPSATGYGLLVSLTNAVVFGTLHRVRGGGPVLAALRANAAVATLGSGAAMLSYLLILWVWSRGVPVAVGAALRDTSVVFAALIAAMALKETLGPRRVAAVALAAAGACALRFA